MVGILPTEKAFGGCSPKPPAGLAGIFLATTIMATGKELLNYVYEKVTSTPDVSTRHEDQPSILNQLGGFLKNLHLPTQSSSPRESISKDVKKTEE